MKALWRALRPALPSKPSPSTTQPRQIPDQHPFEAGDIVLLRHKADRTAPPILSRPLRPGRQVQSHKGVISHDGIIGKRVREVVRTEPSARSSKTGTDFRLFEVTLDEYVRMSRRLVTPIYPADANLITSLFDLHPETCDGSTTSGDELSDDASRLEILEAGTGHGALTLYLSRAIHGANPAFSSADVEDEDALEKWKAKRRAVVHSVEISERHALHAEKVVSGFRRGMYSRNVDFYVGDVGAWVADVLSERGGRPFLSRVFLDLPGADLQIANVARALRTDGTLMIFNPSISQILKCTDVIREQGVSLELDRVVELGNNASSGGREWDVRPVVPRATSKKAQEDAAEKESFLDEEASKEEVSQAGPASTSESQAESSADEPDEGSDVEQPQAEKPENPSSMQPASDPAPKGANRTMVCRPKVGDRITGGGFLGIWRKARPASS